MPGANLPNDYADLVVLPDRRVEVFHVGDGGRLERRLLKEARVVAIHVAGVNTELASLSIHLGHVLISWSPNAHGP